MELMALDRQRRAGGGADESTVEQGERSGINMARLLMSFGAADVPGGADGRLHRDEAELHRPDQPVQHFAADLDHRPDRARHDLRHPHRRHRPVGRLAAGLLRHDRGGRRQGRRANTLSLGTAATQGYGWFAALLAAVVVGAPAGGVQGLAITRLKVPPFVVTLGGLTVFRGLTLTISNGGPISGFDASMRWFGTGLIGPVPVPAIIFAIAAVLCHIVLRYTRYGRAVYAVGGNAEAARLSGLRVDRILISVYVIVGFFAGLAAFVLSARLNSSEAVAGIGYELTVISAVVIGGTSLFGGIGSVGGTVVGAALIGVLQNGLQFNNVSSYTQSIVIGLILILAVAFDRWLKSRVRR